MTPTKQLQNILNQAAEQPENEGNLAVQALEIAFEWCRDSMTAEQLTKNRGKTLKTLLKLNKSLKIAQQLLDTIFDPEILSFAKLGKTLKEELQKKREQIAETLKQHNTLEAELEQLAKEEAALQKRLEEVKNLDQKKATLEADVERLTKLTAHLDELRQQVAIVEQQMPPESVEVESLERQIREKSKQFLTLAEPAQEILNKEARTALRRASKSDKKLKETAKALHEHQERYRHAEELLKERTPVLDLYLKADRDIAEALSGSSFTDIKAVDEALDTAENLLKQADLGLKAAIQANSDAKKLSELSYA